MVEITGRLFKFFVIENYLRNIIESFSLDIRFSRWRKLRLDLSDIFFLFSLH